MSDSKNKKIINLETALSPYKMDEWLKFSPGERLKRSWRLRTKLKNITEIHDQKLFPKP